MDWTWYFFRFDGRINRALLWQALLIVALLAALLGIVDQAISIPDGAKSVKFKFNVDFDFDFGFDGLFEIIDPRRHRLLSSTERASLTLRILGASLFLWISLATAIKRLHDRDRSGWWIIPFAFIPNLLFYFSDRLPAASWFVPFDWAVHALWLWGLVEMFIMPGTSGDNRFGPDPLAQHEEESLAPATPAKSWDQQSELEFVPPSASPPGGMHVKRNA
ncbi:MULTISPECIES: DUF805 domain-containing protein [Bradyrhizobium]|uniref:DUF805 domain-containing protein n=1 Tax=Bradyrhizobium arachidis TaxID=858423 RepID=A0AAE7TEZ2_9BRAD|nr:MULTISPECIES: DUF805 domain-containing protein [Bradyrhizobium]QOG22722.1 DUF805 domain-containing protein [Bradyrhizobium sp. SEMIA]QOZ65679.1 DUF805 domain-containing protein [Bradyrhizobium arachidis]UFW50235.1 DUF805 domain-containing protein [Bradyrhizobium arachidis]SFV18559.1 Uncharacterized membrane protein YhaH, DUF805 family [Bradyrhizobium arachidis]